MKGFLTVVVLLVSTYLAFDVSASQTIRISFKNDPQYPNLLSVSNLTYNWADFRQIVEINADITLSKTLIKGTKVKVNYAVQLPMGVFKDEKEVDLCDIAEDKTMLHMGALSSLAKKCPIKAGVYRIRKLQIDLSDQPFLADGFSATASVEFHKDGRILGKMYTTCIVQ